VAICEACGNESPEGAAYCGACGHRLGEQPEEPVIVNVRVADSPFGGCWSCFTTALAVLVLVGFALWLLSC